MSHRIGTESRKEFVRIHTSIGDYVDLTTYKGNEPELSLKMAQTDSFIEDEDMDISELMESTDIERLFKTFIKKTIINKALMKEVTTINEDYE